jgi:hypothetical protein
VKPRVVTEPITGVKWIATSRGSLLLAWLPVTVAVIAAVLGFFAGRSWLFW